MAAVKIAYVLPRYGVEVVGGAEFAIRMIAERLVAKLGWDVEVLTTCALDVSTWANHYEPGSVVIEGVRVRRFLSESGRHPDFDDFSTPVLLGPPPSREDQERWVDMQGPVSTGLLEAVAASDADVVIFKPYLYHPTVRGVGLVPGRAVMHPAAHDEPALRLPLLREVFASCEGFVFNMVGERRLVEGVAPEAAVKRHLVLGFGIEAPAVEAGAGVGDEPYLLSLGRVDKAKGSLLLASWFAAYKERRPGPLKLVLAGQVADSPVGHPDIVLRGVVDEDTKWELLAGATAVVQPSPYESLSLALLEGWAVGRPAIVNEACEATTEHCRRSGGGLSFTGYASFEVILDRLLGDAGVRDGLGRAGQAYVHEYYNWPTILARYAEFLREIAVSSGGSSAGGPESPPRSRRTG
jgi:glycosyltransferase involved in cell wall biosynthesis